MSELARKSMPSTEAPSSDPRGSQEEHKKLARLLSSKLENPHPPLSSAPNPNPERTVEPFPGAFTQPNATFGDFGIEDKITKIKQDKAIAAARAKAKQHAANNIQVTEIPSTEDFGFTEIAEDDASNDLPRETTFIGKPPTKTEQPRAGL